MSDASDCMHAHRPEQKLLSALNPLLHTWKNHVHQPTGASASSASKSDAAMFLHCEMMLLADGNCTILEPHIAPQRSLLVCQWMSITSDMLQNDAQCRFHMFWNISVTDPDSACLVIHHHGRPSIFQDHHAQKHVGPLIKCKAHAAHTCISDSTAMLLIDHLQSFLS